MDLLKNRVYPVIFSFGAVYLLSAVIVYLSLAPVEVKPPGGVYFFDKVLHSFCYFFLSFIVVNSSLRSAKPRPVIFAFCYAFSLGAFLEICQFFVAWRDFEIGDILANIIGSGIGSLITVYRKG
ncbi:MAG: VanZ family protein [Candidatus Omnitrophica bacterium]|nr:VanZ family protein [Candidatus Omnitrophota bacterium]